MPAFLVTLLIQIGVVIVQKLGVPYLMEHFPNIAPLLQEILALIVKKQEPSTALKIASDTHAKECDSLTACPPTLK